MSQQVFANLVAKMDLESAKFQKELKGAAKQTTKFKKDAKAANDATTRLSQGLRRAANSAAFVTGPMGGVSSRLNIMASGLTSIGPAGLVATAAITALTVAVAQSVKVFSEYEQGQLRTEAIVKSTGASAGRTAAQIEALASNVALSTLASVSGARQAANVLQTFKAVQGSVFDDSLRMSQDMAAVLGGDMTSNAKMLGKALEDPIKGINAMTRAGVSFTDAEKQKIEVMVQGGKTAEAQRLILAALQAQLGGAGSAEAGGVAGAADTLGQRWDEMMLSIANTAKTGDGATWFFNTLAAGMKSISDQIDPAPMLKMNQLLADKLKLERQLANSAGNGRRAAQLKNELEATIAQMNKIEEARVQETKKENDALAAAEKYRVERERQRQADTLAKKQEAGAQSFEALSRQMASEQQRIELDYQSRNEIVRNMVLSKVAIEQSGFESIHALKQHYLQLSQTQADQELEQIKLKAAKESAVKAEAREKERQDQAEQQALLAEQNRGYWERYLASLEEVTVNMNDLTASSLEHLSRSVGQTFEKMIFDSQSLGDSVQNMMEGMSRTVVRMLGDMAAQWLVYQAVQMLVGKSTATAGATALASNAAAASLQAGLNAFASTAAIPIVGPAAAPAAMAAAIGVTAPIAASISTLAASSVVGMAHSGMDAIPNEGTWLLDKGERVYTNDSAQKLDQMYGAVMTMQQGAIPNMSQKATTPNVTINLIENAQLAGQVQQETAQNGEQSIDIFVANIRSGGDAALVLEQTYNFQRVGY
ncbi:phage tail length tape measure family protein [Shewanella surugensis]|uniref:Phage tail length tape measure family protein n=1 Tax=Shewanella surugensis TaxID=212020 RepID=A0ABT0LG81_9GAMM|nr:phage tail length tape measure family protein [Shewanella surugensis]MCL1126706.1 phage tail length tape measure family protein [Shewanella surugensis]